MWRFTQSNATESGQIISNVTSLRRTGVLDSKVSSRGIGVIRGREKTGSGNSVIATPGNARHITLKNTSFGISISPV
jgi:hypothetical protein